VYASTKLCVPRINFDVKGRVITSDEDFLNNESCLDREMKDEEFKRAAVGVAHHSSPRLEYIFFLESRLSNLSGNSDGKTSTLN